MGCFHDSRNKDEGVEIRDAWGMFGVLEDDVISVSQEAGQVHSPFQDQLSFAHAYMKE